MATLRRGQAVVVRGKVGWWGDPARTPAVRMGSGGAAAGGQRGDASDEAGEKGGMTRSQMWFSGPRVSLNLGRSEICPTRLGYIQLEDPNNNVLHVSSEYYITLWGYNMSRVYTFERKYVHIRACEG